MYKKDSKFTKKIRKIILDAKKFNKKVDDYIKNTNKYLESSPKHINKGTIREMVELDKIVIKQQIEKENKRKYQLAKRKYESDLHNIMEKLINIKEK